MRTFIAHTAFYAVTVLSAGCGYPHANPVDPDYDGSNQASLHAEIVGVSVVKGTHILDTQAFSVVFTIRNVGPASLPDVRLSFDADDSDVSLSTFFTRVPIASVLAPGGIAMNADSGERLRVEMPVATLPRTVDVNVTVHYSAGRSQPDGMILLRESVSFD